MCEYTIFIKHYMTYCFVKLIRMIYYEVKKLSFVNHFSKLNCQHTRNKNVSFSKTKLAHKLYKQIEPLIKKPLRIET